MTRNRIRNTVASAAIVLAGGAAGFMALGNSASAADTSGTTATAAAPAAPAADATKAPQGPHQANGITETPLTGDELAKATAAANTAAPGSTIERAETDADGDSFEVHITKADGSKATVKLNADFTVKTVETGGPGGPGGHHGKGGPAKSGTTPDAQATPTVTTA